MGENTEGLPARGPGADIPEEDIPNSQRGLSHADVERLPDRSSNGSRPTTSVASRDTQLTTQTGRDSMNFRDKPEQVRTLYRGVAKDADPLARPPEGAGNGGATLSYWTDSYDQAKKYASDC